MLAKTDPPIQIDIFLSEGAVTATFYALFASGPNSLVNLS